LGQGFAAYATGGSSGLTATAIFTDAVANPGVAPVNPPCGGFSIDGDLLANTPSVTNGDWIVTNTFAGTGCGVLHVDGTPIDTNITFHYFDAQNSSSDNNFSSGKLSDDPNTWKWANGTVGDKVDINHALVHITKDSSNHTWLVVSGDRYKDTGASYIDFEFMQTPLFVTTNAGGTTGGFTNNAPNCGRTTNDFLLTIAFTHGGSTAGFFV